MKKLNLTQEWDKVFPKSDKVDHKKVTFHNRYGITLAADMYTPRGCRHGILPTEILLFSVPESSGTWVTSGSGVLVFQRFP